MKAALIYNKKSGTETLTGKEYSKNEIENIFSDSGIEIKTYEVEGKDIINKTNDAKENFNIIIAAGGDGTVSGVTSQIAFSDKVLGVLPLGTLNHFAKDLGLPLTVEEAIKVIKRNNQMKIDVASVNEKIFINNSSIGLYPKTVKEREKQEQRIGGNKWVAMAKASMFIFKKFPLVKVNIASEDQNINAKTPFVFISNNEYEFDIFNLGKRERLNEGILCVYHPTAKHKSAIFRYALYAFINKLKQEKDFNILKSKSIQLETKKSEIEVAMDGEVFKIKTPLLYKSHHKALNIIIP